MARPELKVTILAPALKDASERQYVSDIEYKTLVTVIDAPSQLIQAGDIAGLSLGKTASDSSRQLRVLRDRHMLQPEKENGRKHTIRFNNSYLLVA